MIGETMLHMTDGDSIKIKRVQTTSQCGDKQDYCTISVSRNTIDTCDMTIFVSVEQYYKLIEFRNELNRVITEIYNKQ